MFLSLEGDVRHETLTGGEVIQLQRRQEITGL